MVQPDRRAAYPCTQFCCEENIWQLVKVLVDEGVEISELQVIYISNPKKAVVIYEQNNALDRDHMVWDYHVILWHRDETGDQVYDFDSRLPFPCDAGDYFQRSFKGQYELSEEYEAHMRVIPAAEYLHDFYSTRRHMKGVIPEEIFPP